MRRFQDVEGLHPLSTSFGTCARSSVTVFVSSRVSGARRTALAAENLFLRKQLALFQEREKKAIPKTPADRFVLPQLARWFNWRGALMIAKPATLIGWHRSAFRLFWRWKSQPVGGPRVSVDVRNLIRRLAAENATWGEQRNADELLLKLQIRHARWPNTASNHRGHADQETSAGLVS